MTWAAERPTVLDIPPTIGEERIGFDMVGLQPASALSAELTGPVVAFENLVTPFSCVETTAIQVPFTSRTRQISPSLGANQVFRLPSSLTFPRTGHGIVVNRRLQPHHFAADCTGLLFLLRERCPVAGVTAESPTLADYHLRALGALMRHAPEVRI